MIAIIDYGSGNLRSISNAFRFRQGADALVTSSSKPWMKRCNRPFQV